MSGHLTYPDGWCPSCEGTHPDAPSEVRTLRYPLDPQDDLDSLPLGMFVGANRYDTDDTHVLHLWTAAGESFDVRWDKAAAVSVALPEEPQPTEKTQQ